MNRDRYNENRAYCRSCPERCFPDDEPMESKEPTALDRIAYDLSQWVSHTVLPGMARVAKVIRAVKNGE